MRKKFIVISASSLLGIGFLAVYFLQSYKNGIPSLKNTDSLNRSIYETYFKSMDTSLASDTALFSTYRSELAMLVRSYVNQNKDSISSGDNYQITSYSSNGEILNTANYLVPFHNDEPLVSLSIENLNAIKPTTILQEGVYYQRTEGNSDVIKLSNDYYDKHQHVNNQNTVYMMPRSYYDRLASVSYHNVNPNGEQQILNELSSSFQGLGQEQNIINTINSSFYNGIDNADPAVGWNWALEKLNYINTLDIPYNRNYNKSNTTQVEIAGGDNSQPWHPTGTTVVSFNSPVVFGAGATEAGNSIEILSKNTIRSDCPSFNNYLKTVGVTDKDGETHPRFAGVIKIDKKQPWFIDIEYDFQTSVKGNLVCRQAVHGHFKTLKPNYSINVIEWIPTHPVCSGQAAFINQKIKAHEAKHERDILEITQDAIKSQGKMLQDFQVCGDEKSVVKLYDDMILQKAINVKTQLWKQFDDFSLLVDMEQIKLCNCHVED